MRRKLFVVASLVLAVAATAEEPRVALPADYKETFVEYLSLDRIMNPDQFIRLFANETASRGPKTNGELENGSVLVAEVYSVQKNEAGQVKTSKLGRRIPKELLLIAVMEKQESFGIGPASTIDIGNWDMAAYLPSWEVATKNLDACRACHARLTQRDFVFSIEHLRSP
ncbi:MAG: cytochrome P460 family protein [Pseudomonadota bacterium]